MRITKNANYRLAANASVFEHGSGVARHTPLIAERRAAMAREANVFDRGSGVTRHTSSIAELDDASILRNMLTAVTHDHRGTERSWRPHANNACNSPAEIEILKSVLRPCSNITAQPCSSLGPERILALPAKLCFSLGLEHKWRGNT